MRQKEPCDGRLSSTVPREGRVKVPQLTRRVSRARFMYEYITIIIVSIWITISLIYGGLLWMKRKEVPDRSRTYLSVLCFLTAIGISNYIVAAIRHDVADYSHQLLQPELTIGGLWAISMFVCYPIEVMRPRGLRGRWLALLFLPSLLATLPAVFGMHFQALHSWADLWAHIGEFNVLLRLLCLAMLTLMSLQGDSLWMLLLRTRLPLWEVPAAILVLCFFVMGQVWQMPKPLIRLGDVSYALCLVHYYPLLFLDRKVFDFSTLTPLTLVGALLGIALSIALAYAAWRFIEQPCVNLLKKHLGR